MLCYVLIGAEGFVLQLSRGALGDVGAFYISLLLVTLQNARLFLRSNYYYLRAEEALFRGRQITVLIFFSLLNNSKKCFVRLS